MTAAAEPPARGRGRADLLPGPLADWARLAVAGLIEGRLRRSNVILGAALVFHGVAEHPGDLAREIDPATDRGRLADMVRYASRRYRLVRAAELAPIARARRSGERIPVAFTFDDDLPSHLDQAAPVFAGCGGTATAFLCGAREPFWWQLLQRAIDERAIAPADLAPVPAELVAAALDGRSRAAYRLAGAVERLAPSERDPLIDALAAAVGRDAPPMLGDDGAAALLAAGWEIGFHTRRHDLLTGLDDDRLAAALRPEPIGGDGLPRTLAYPHGKAGSREARAARSAGYVAAFTGTRQRFDEETDDHLIGRLQPDVSTLGRFAMELARLLSAP